jgi:GT2 family glycosyltransferase
VQKLVSIIIPTYNRREQVISCIRSIENVSYDNKEVIIVDNNSNDGTVEVVRKMFPKVKICELNFNAGAVGGRNEGVRLAKGEYLCFVDSDNIVDSDFLTELVKHAESDRSIGFIGPKMYYRRDPDRIWCAGVKINFWTSRTRYIGINEIDKGQFEDLSETDQIPNVWMVKREVINDIGKMDEIYVMSYGETDWPLRARRAGYRIIYCPSSIVYHDIDVPKNTGQNIMVRGNSFRIYYIARNRTIFMKKHASTIQFLLYLVFFNNLFLIAYIGVYIRYKRKDLIGVHLKGYLDGLRTAFRKKINGKGILKRESNI